jgi:predicted PilT family ATPase
MTVKVPTGFRDVELARPVVEVRDFHTHQLAFELYSFGQDVVVNPINPLKSKRSKRRSEDPSKFSSFERSSFKNEKIELNITVENDKLLIKADPEFASQNINIYAEEKLIFTGSLSRKSEMTLSLSNKEGKKLSKEIESQKDLYGRIK